MKFYPSKNSYVDLPNNGKLNFYGPHTLAFWVYLDDVTGGQVIFDQAAK